MRLDVRKIIPSGGDLALVIVEWTEWTTGETKHWAATATDIVRKQPDGKVLIGGTMQDVDGHAAPGIARLNVDGSVDTDHHFSLSR